MTLFLNTRLLAYPAPNSPVVMASVQGTSIQPDNIYSPAFLQQGTQQLEDVRHKFSTRGSIDTLTGDIVSASHLELLVKEIRLGKIQQESVTLMSHPTAGIIIQLHLK